MLNQLIMALSFTQPPFAVRRSLPLPPRSNEPSAGVFGAAAAALLLGTAVVTGDRNVSTKAPVADTSSFPDDSVVDKISARMVSLDKISLDTISLSVAPKPSTVANMAPSLPSPALPSTLPTMDGSLLEERLAVILDVRERVVAALRETTETNTKLRAELESLYAQNAGLSYTVDSRVFVGLKQAVKALRRSSAPGAEQASAAKQAF